jgi:hypothetical protein
MPVGHARRPMHVDALPIPRAFAPSLPSQVFADFYKEWRHAFNFVGVYIAEAHAQDKWPISSARYNGTRGPVLIPEPSSDERRCQVGDPAHPVLGPPALSRHPTAPAPPPLAPSSSPLRTYGTSSSPFP